ncbi:methylated-DNA--protein-cysteine methyltransferase [Pangasianodon hypophthalmus]|uniref:methylated-DNA--protein-cysteine methyltransferase n=1 Tax=Pangasianodon hypophthalmus TaxID=310915 RepID=UPI0023072B4D|nr:methylated-DNA--protein-cysteine methyltransferase [Pangasianodon hypophthalmus]
MQHHYRSFVASVKFISKMQKQRNACVLQCVSLESPVGELLLSGCEKGVHTITIAVETKHRPGLISDQAELNSELQQCVTWLQSYFRSAQSVSSLPFPALHHPLLQGDSFTARVLRILQSRVQVGQTVSYKELSEMAGNPKAARAVGSVMRRNPVPLIVPCHRVLCSSGESGRYMGGKGDNIKLWLLSHEEKSDLTA